MFLDDIKAFFAGGSGGKKPEGSSASAHKVKSGETLYSVARKYGVSVADLKKANGLKDDTIKEGAALKIPSVQKAEKSETAKTVKKKPSVFGDKIVKDESKPIVKEISDERLSKPTALHQKAGTHYLKQGETIASVEKAYGYSRGELVAANPKLKNKKLGLKQEIQLPEHVIVTNVNNAKDAAKALGMSESFVKHMEKMEKKRSKGYDDGAGNLTIGIGHHAFTDFEKKYYKNKSLSEKETYTLFTQDMAKAQNAVKKGIGDSAFAKLNQNQREALTDFVFNRGESAFRSDNCKGLRQALIKGDYEAAAVQIGRSKSLRNGDIKLGISNRRLYEMAHFCGGKFSKKILASAQNLYNQGVEGRTKNDSIVAGHNEQVQQWFRGKLKIA